MAGELFARKTKNMVFIFTHFTFIVVLKLGDLEMKNLTTVLHVAALGALDHVLLEHNTPDQILSTFYEAVPDVILASPNAYRHCADLMLSRWRLWSMMRLAYFPKEVTVKIGTVTSAPGK
jgi:hypothetical protein